MRRLFASLAVVLALAGQAGAFGWEGSGGGFNGAYKGYKLPYILAASAAPVSVGGTLVETQLASFTIPAGLMGANGEITVETLWSWDSAATGNKTLKVYFGSASILNSNQSGTLGALACRKTVSNRNNQLFQTAGSSQSESLTTFTGVGAQNLSVDTTQAVPISITGKVLLETALSAPTVTANGVIATVTQTSHGLNTGDWVKVAGGSVFSVSGSPNVDPVQVIKIDTNTFAYACSGSGTLATQPTIQRYSRLTLEKWSITLNPGVN